MKEKDDKIFNLSRELTSWQSRVPPLVERFQTRDREARALEGELEDALARLQAMEEQLRSENTRIEPVDADSLPHGGDASNEPIASTSVHETVTLQDQIDDGAEEIDELEDFVEPVDEGEVQPVAADEEFQDVFSSGRDDPDPESESISRTLADQDGHEDAMDRDPEAAPREGGSPEDDEPDFVEESSGAGIAAPADGDFDLPGGHAFAGNGQAAPVTAGGDRDDLQKIKGIGPSIEKTLNDLGVCRFHQIAEMSEYEIDRVAQQLKGFRSRIYREDWIGQARDLQYEKNNRRT
jgi:predicted flap endonuclease-1-like 5' DNA nuclease